MDLVYLSILLLLLAIAFGILEVFIPSGGVLACLSVLSVIASIVVAFADRVETGAIMLAVSAVLIPCAIGVGIWLWPNTPIGRRILIGRPTSEEVLPDGDEYRVLRELIGQRGRCRTEMLPGGIVVVAGREFDAVSVGMPIRSGETIEVVDVQTNHIVVRPATGAEPPPENATEEDVLSQPIDSLGLDPLDDPLA